MEVSMRWAEWRTRATHLRGRVERVLRRRNLLAGGRGRRRRWSSGGRCHDVCGCERGVRGGEEGDEAAAGCLRRARLAAELKRRPSAGRPARHSVRTGPRRHTCRRAAAPLALAYRCAVDSSGAAPLQLLRWRAALWPSASTGQLEAREPASDSSRSPSSPHTRVGPALSSCWRCCSAECSKHRQLRRGSSLGAAHPSDAGAARGLTRASGAEAPAPAAARLR